MEQLTTALEHTDGPDLVGIKDMVVEIQAQLRVNESKPAKNAHFASVMIQAKGRDLKRDKEKERLDAIWHELVQPHSRLEELEQSIDELEVDQHLLLEELQQAGPSP